MWFGRFIGEPFDVEELDQELYAGFAALRAERGASTSEIEAGRGSTDAQLEGKLRYTSIVKPRPQEYDLWVCVTHFFNHQTHHRGQVTALLSQCGKDYGVTDLIWLPEVVPAAR